MSPWRRKRRHQNFQIVISSGGISATHEFAHNNGALEFGFPGERNREARRDGFQRRHSPASG